MFGCAEKYTAQCELNPNTSNICTYQKREAQLVEEREVGILLIFGALGQVGAENTALGFPTQTSTLPLYSNVELSS